VELSLVGEVALADEELSDEDELLVVLDEELADELSFVSLEDLLSLPLLLFAPFLA
jgi:hypothetical protein